MPARAQVNLKLRPEDLAELRRYAEDEGLSLAAYLVEAARLVAGAREGALEILAEERAIRDQEESHT